MADIYLGDENAGGFLTEDLAQDTPTKGQVTSRKEAQDVRLESGLTREEYEGLQKANQIALEEIKAETLAPPGVTGIFGSLVDERADPETFQTQVEKQRTIQETLEKTRKFSSVDKALAYDRQVGEELWKMEHRRGVVSDRLLDMAEEYSDGFGGDVLELIDMIAYDTVTGLANLPSALAGEGSEVTRLSEEWAYAIRTYDDEAFDAFVEERIHALSTSGLSGKEAAWRVLRELEAIDSAGTVVGDKRSAFVFGVLDAFGVAHGLKSAVKVGRSAVGRLKSTAGTRASSEAAASTDVVLHEGLDGEILDSITAVEDLTGAVTGRSGRTESTFGSRRKGPRTVADDVEDAEILDDIAPSYMRSGATPAQKAEPPVSAGYVGRRWAENSLIRNFLTRQANYSFGTLDLTKEATSWAKQKASRMALAASSSVMDVAVEEFGIKQMKAKLTFGKLGGSPFRSYTVASKVAKETPGAFVIDTRSGLKATGDTGSYQYAVVVETMVPSQKLVEPLDLSQVTSKTMIGRLFGKADRGSIDEMSNLADFSEHGGQGFLQDAKRVFKQVRKLSSKEREAVDSILTDLRDTPTKGGARSWLSSAEFAEQYRMRTGEYPTKKVFEAYENVMQLSDFSWWVRANDRLRVLGNQEALVTEVRGNSVFIFPTTVKAASLKEKTEAVWAWDVAAQKRVSVKKLRDDVQLRALGTASSDGIEYVVNFQGRTRLPALDDAFPYSAGGPRSNPDITWFVGENSGGWATLIGARSEGEAAKAAKQYNKIAAELSRILGKTDDPSFLSKAQKDWLDELVLENNDWNVNIESVDDFIEFAKSRGVSFKSPVIHRGRNEKLSSVIHVNDQSLVDMSLESYISYHRHDEALLEFGGARAANPDPIYAVQNQFLQMSSRGAHTQYRMSHPTSWVKAVERAIERNSDDVTFEMVDGSGPVANLSALPPMTDELKVRNLKIGGDSEVARKLRQEQSVILRRLDLMEGSVAALPTGMMHNAASKSAVAAAEAIYDRNKVAGSITKWLADNLVKKLPNKLLSLGFFQRMASPDQLLLQATHFLPLVAMSPKNGSRGMSMALVIRQAAREGDANLWGAIYSRLGAVSGLDEDSLKQLVDHMLYSGRGYMKGAIAEDPTAGLSNSMLGKAKDIVSAPYYAGENFSATLSRITAFLDIRELHPTLDVNSPGFWNEVTKRDRILSYGLNKAQKSGVQADPVMSVVTQWTSYPLRTMETLFFEKGLTVVERGRLAAYTTMFWGLAGLGLNKWATDAEESLPSPLGPVIAHGADVVFDSLFGVQVGDRVGFNPIELYQRAFETFSDTPQTIPAIQIVDNTATAVLQGMSDVVNNRRSLLGHDAMTLARTWKVVDSAVMAWTMAVEDARISRSGSTIEGPFTPMQEVLQAIGIKPSEATELGATSNLLFDARKRRDAAIDKATPVFNMVLKAAEEGKYSKAVVLLRDYDSILKAYNLPETRLAEAQQTIFERAGFDRINWMTLELVKEGYSNEALKFNEMMNKE